MALALPVLYLLRLLPLPTPDEAVAAQHTARLFLAPGSLALKALLLYPLLEEIFYRGLMLQLLRRYLPLWLAVLLPNLLFAFTHVGAGVGNVLFAFIIGLVLSWLVLRSRSLFPSILCHSAVNLSVLFVINPIFAAHDLHASAEMLQPFALAFLASCVALAVASFEVLHGEFPARHVTRSSANASVTASQVSA